MENTRKHFPVLDSGIYANTASAGLLSSGLAQWRRQHDNDYMTGGSAMKTKAMLTGIPEIREKVACFFGCKTENTALVPNFSLGLNILLEGLDKSHKVLLITDDYPSVNWPFEHRNCTVSYATTEGDFEQSILERIQADKISILALSLVQWTNGLCIDMKFLKMVKNKFPELLIVADGTQFCGTTDFYFEDSPLDVLGASGYKWLLAGYGNGFFLFKDGVENHFSVNTIGFNSANADVNAADNIRFSKHFEPGHLDTLNFGSLGYSLDYLKNQGMVNIERHLKELSQLAKKEFTRLGLLETAVASRKTHSTIFNINGDDRLFQHLSDKGVVCSQRGKGVRLSFHFYNDKEDIENIVRILKTVV